MKKQSVGSNAEDTLIEWKTNAWKDPNMVAWYSQRMVDSSGTMRLHNLLETSLCEQFASGERILDVGVGTGRGSLPLARKGFNVTGVDSSQAMLDECRRLAGETPITLLQGDVLDLPVDDEHFDTVMALNVVTHFPHWQEFLGEWQKKVRRGGRIMFDIYSLDHLSHVKGRQITAEQIISEGNVEDFSMHASVEEVAACADKLGLKILDIVPYAGLYSSKFIWRDSNRSLASLNWWNRLLSWISVDDSFLDFTLFLEREFFSRLSSCMTGRFMVILEKTVDTASNKQWLDRNATLNNMLQSEVTLENLAPYLSLETPKWRAILSRHLDLPRHLVCFYHVWTNYWKHQEVVRLESLLEERHQKTLEIWAMRDRIDDSALSFANSLLRAPEVSGIFTHNNVSFDDSLAYELTRTMLRDGFHAFSGSQS